MVWRNTLIDGDRREVWGMESQFSVDDDDDSVLKNMKQIQALCEWRSRFNSSPHMYKLYFSFCAGKASVFQNCDSSPEMLVS